MKKIKIIFLWLVFITTAYMTYKIFMEINFKLTNDEFLDLLLLDPSIANESITSKGVMKKAIQLITNVELEKPVSILGLDNIIDNNQNDNNELIIITDNKPLIYLYNSHQKEQYASGALEAYNITPNVVMTSYIMQEAFKEKGIIAVVEEQDVNKLLKKAGYDYTGCYKITRNFLNKQMKENKSIKYFIDVHRDSVSKKISTVSINDKNYARTMFVIGMNNDNNSKNRKILDVLDNKLNELYPGLSRGIYKRNSVYNQDLSENVILIEMGGVNNTMEEVYNSSYAIVELFSWYINEYEKR